MFRGMLQNPNRSVSSSMQYEYAVKIWRENKLEYSYQTFIYELMNCYVISYV